MKNIRSIWDEAVSKYNSLSAVRWLEKKEIKEKKYGELDQMVRNIRAYLDNKKYRGSHIALIGTSSAEWIEAYLGIVTGVNIAVPLDANLPDEELIELIQRSDSEALFLGATRSSLKEKVLRDCPKIRDIWMLTESDFGTFPVTTINISGASDYEIATIIYTSGTTGKSKGVMLTQENLSDNVRAVEYDAAPGCVTLSVLPIHHAYCLVMDWLKTLSLGTTICINDSFMHMVRNMGIFKPEVMLMVPLMIETIYKKVSAVEADAIEKMKNESATKDKKGILFSGKTSMSEDILSIVKKNIAEKVFGGNLRIIFTGGAHLDPFYIEKFAEYGVDILEGYGMSECSPVITTNTVTNHKPGSIGRPLSNVEIGFENGEILVRGSSVMKGYYKMPEETSETLKDGWLHTGDKGYLDEDGYLFINGRVKNLIIMSNGENVSPEEIENKLALNPLIAEVIVTGENNGLTARIYPEAELAEKKGLSVTDLYEELQKFIDEYNSGQPTYRHITAIVVRSTPFIRNSTGKIKRQDALKENPAA
ncbi:AMP-binding protein [Butyrivibrio sp. AE3004]|uniref:AMP-binding protein n=1 Tax=Butyrivibrio sp. AE3004 TaxID=1506994 RepID=UPI0004946595|nr:AMP-binding protein [Butyrivibrio sp. AE3004]